MKSVIIVSLLASATAFAPALVSRPATTLNEFANGYVGGEGPEPMFIGETGSQNFDPAGFCTRAPDWVPWFRESELKHGRAAMLGVLGFVVPEFVRVPGEQFSFEAVPKVIDAHDACPDSMIQIFGWISFLEAVSFPALANMNEFDREPGNFNFDPLNLMPKEAAKADEMRLKELKNGRLAMVALGGMVAGSLVTGHGFPYLPEHMSGQC